MVFVFCVLCIIVYCAEKFWDLYTKNEEFSHSEASTFLHATRKFLLSFPPEILNSPERKTKIGTSGVKWQGYSEAHCFENDQKKNFDRENAMKMAKKSKNGPKSLCIFVYFLAILAVFACVWTCVLCWTWKPILCFQIGISTQHANTAIISTRTKRVEKQTTRETFQQQVAAHPPKTLNLLWTTWQNSAQWVPRIGLKIYQTQFRRIWNLEIKSRLYRKLHWPRIQVRTPQV